MTASTNPTSDLSRLPWQTQGEYQVAADDRCFYMRESTGSMIAGVLAFVVMAVSTGWFGGWLLLTQTTVMKKTLGGMIVIVGVIFVYLLWSTLRRGRWMIVYDRGLPGTLGEIRYNGKRLSAERVRCISTKRAGGMPPKSTVVAELHDGTYELLGPCSVLTWPAHYAQQAATWMGLAFRHSIN